MLEEVRDLFDEVLDAYISLASDAALADIALDEVSDDIYDDEQYKYELSRIETLADEWRGKLDKIFDAGNPRMGR